jgi:hypothetical protein
MLKGVWLVAVLGVFLAWIPVGKAAEAPQKLHLEVSGDIDYNTNATQQPGNGLLAYPVNGGGSLVLTNALKVQYNFNPTGPWDVETKYELFQNYYTRFSFVDTMMHTWTLNPSYSLGTYRNMKVWLPFAFNYTDVGSDKYYTSFALSPQFFHRVSQQMGYALEMRLLKRYGWIPQFNPGLFDYTSRNFGLSAGYYYFIGKKGGYLQARCSYDLSDARGRNNDYSGYRLTLSGEYPAGSRLNFILYLDLALRPYWHDFIGSVPPVSDARNDKVMILGVIMECKIYKGLVGSLHYYLNRQDSNVPLYDYTAHILGAQLAYKY